MTLKIHNKLHSLFSVTKGHKRALHLKPWFLLFRKIYTFILAQRSNPFHVLNTFYSIFFYLILNQEVYFVVVVTTQFCLKPVPTFPDYMDIPEGHRRGCGNVLRQSPSMSACSLAYYDITAVRESDVITPHGTLDAFLNVREPHVYSS